MCSRSIRGHHGFRDVDVVVRVRELHHHHHHRHWHFCVETGGWTGRWYPLYVGAYGLAHDWRFGCFDFRQDNGDHCPWTLEAISPSFSPLPKPSYQAVLTFTLLQLGRLR